MTTCAELTYDVWLHEPARGESNLTVVIPLTTILNSPKLCGGRL